MSYTRVTVGNHRGRYCKLLLYTERTKLDYYHQNRHNVSEIKTAMLCVDK